MSRGARALGARPRRSRPLLAKLILCVIAVCVETGAQMLAAEREDAAATLGGLEGVAAVRALGDGPRFELTLKPAAEPAAVLRAAVLADLEVVQFKPAEQRLEQRLRDALEEDGQ